MRQWITEKIRKRAEGSGIKSAGQLSHSAPMLSKGIVSQGAKTNFQKELNKEIYAPMDP